MTPEEIEDALRAYHWMPESCKGCGHLKIMSADDGYRFDVIRCKVIENEGYVQGRNQKKD